MPVNVLTTHELPIMKFHPSCRTEGLLEGNFYMKTLEYYRNLESETSDCLIEDSKEALIHINDAVVVMESLSTGKVETGIVNDVSVKTIHSDDFVLCMTGINTSKLDSFEFTSEQKEKMIGFGDRVLLITNTAEFC